MSNQTIGHKPIRQLTPNQYIDGTYAIMNPQVGTTRAGKPYLKCIIRDASGECPARQWSIEQTDVKSLSNTGFVWVAGHTQEFNGSLQLIVEKIESVEVTTEQLRELLPSTRFDIDEMFADVERILGTIEDDSVKALVQAYFADDKLMAGFKEAPAAVSMHHAWIGGLLEHTRNLLRLADAMLPNYPELNRDIVLAGLFLHDLGKTVELSWARGFNYTATGNLIGHIAIGAMWLERKIGEAVKAGGPRLSGKAHLVLSHIILSHHGEPEFGAAKRPSTPEAIFIAMLDNLDAKTAMAIQHARHPDDDDAATTPEGLFTDKIWALDTKLFKPDPTK